MELNELHQAVLVSRKKSLEIAKAEAERTVAELDIDKTQRSIEEMLSIIKEKRSIAMFYFGILLGVLTGVLGNYFVSYIFALSELSTEMAVLGFIFSGAILVILCTVLWKKIGKYLA